MISDTLSNAAAEIRHYLTVMPEVYADAAPLIRDLLAKMDTVRALLDAPPNRPAEAKTQFKIGDRVRHSIRDECGTVTVLENGTVKVEFDNAAPSGRVSVGEYDEAWFRQHPNTLVAWPK